MADRSGARSKVLFWGNLALGTAIFAYVMYAYGAGAIAVLRLDVSPRIVLAFVAVAGATLVCLAWRWGFVLGGLSKPPGLPVLTLYRSASHTLDVLAPTGKVGGDPLRAWLTVRSGVPVSHSIASTAVDRTLEIGASAPFSVIFALLLLQHGVPQLERALVTVTVASAALMLGVLMALRRLRSGAGLVSALMKKTGADRWPILGSRMEVIEDSEYATAALAGDRRRMLVAFAGGILANLLVIAEFALLLQAFGLPANGVAVVGAIFATGAAHMFPIPGGIGVLEGAQMWLFEMLGYSADIGLAVGLAVRFRELLWMAPGVAYLVVRSFRASLDGTTGRPA